MVALARTPEGTAARPGAAVRRRWPPAAVRTRRFWLAVAPASPMVFGSVSLAIVVLPEEVTSARSLSTRPIPITCTWLTSGSPSMRCPAVG